MEILRERADKYEVEELACKIIGLCYDEIDADESIINEKLNEEFYIDLDIFQDIIERLLPLIEKGKSPLTNNIFKGFADKENQIWLVKSEVK